MVADSTFVFFFAGLFSTIMRDLASINNDCPKWIVLDGDIDPMWIESLNTVMDDNKVTRLHSQFHNYSDMITQLVLEGKDLAKESEGQRNISSVPNRIRTYILPDHHAGNSSTVLRRE